MRSVLEALQTAYGVLVTSPQLESYEKFLNAVRHRAELGDADFPVISHRLKDYTAADLIGNGATWHRNCYADAVHSHKVERAEKAYQRKVLLTSRDITDKENSAPVLVPVSDRLHGLPVTH